MEKKYLGFAVGNGFLLFLVFFALGSVIEPLLNNQNIRLLVGLIALPVLTMLIEFFALRFKNIKMPLYFYAISYLVFFIIIVFAVIFISPRHFSIS